MDIEEFEKRVQPSAKRSRLEPFRSQIFELKAKGYADWQVRDWLAANGLEISRQAVQQFFKKEAKAERVHAPPVSTNPQRVHAAINTEPPAAAPQGLTPKGETQAPAPDEPEDDLAGKSQVEANKARRERKAQQFIKDEPTNSVIKLLKDKKS